MSEHLIRLRKGWELIDLDSPDPRPATYHPAAAGGLGFSPPAASDSPVRMPPIEPSKRITLAAAGIRPGPCFTSAQRP